MIFKNPQYPEILHVCQNLRQMSKDEMFGTKDIEDPAKLAKELFNAPGFKWVFYNAGKPVALLGAINSWSGVYALFGIGTDDWQSVWREVTRVARRDMFDAVKATGAHRAHCMTLASHTDTHKWLRLLGAKDKVVLNKYGKNGEDYVMFSWLKEV